MGVAEAGQEQPLRRGGSVLGDDVPGLLSTIAVVVLENRYPDSKILANVGNVVGFGVLWLAKFFILDRILFKVTHEHPEGPAPFL